MCIMKNILFAGLMLFFSCMKGEAQSGAKKNSRSFLNILCFQQEMIM